MSKILNEKLICDVMLPPATIIKRGCDLRTLLVAINQRGNLPPAQRVLREAALAKQPAPVAVPDGWRDVIENARESIGAGALQENANTERRYVEPYLDGIYDELEALEKEAAPAAPAPAPAPEPQEPAAWLVHGGRTWADRVYLSHPQATQAVETRRDGSQLTALYAAPPAAEQPECSGCRGLAAEITALRSGKEYCGACPDGCASCRVCEDSPPVDAAEQPDTVKVPRELLERHLDEIGEYAWDTYDEMHALLGKEGE